MFSGSRSDGPDAEEGAGGGMGQGPVRLASDVSDSARGSANEPPYAMGFAMKERDLGDDF